MTRRRRQLLLLVMLTATLLVAYKVSGSSGGISEDVVVSASDGPSTISAASTPDITEMKSPNGLGNLDRPVMREAVADLFATKAWYVPPSAPPSTRVMEPSVPIVPALPFTYVGRFDDGNGKTVVYLAKGDQSFAVGQGETFDDVYRLDGIEKGNLVIQYLPMATKQLLPIGGES